MNNRKWTTENEPHKMNERKWIGENESHNIIS